MTMINLWPKIELGGTQMNRDRKRCTVGPNKKKSYTITKIEKKDYKNAIEFVQDPMQKL